MKIPVITLLLLSVLSLSLPVSASQVVVVDAWTRVSMPGQRVGGVYMKIQANQNARLVGVASTAVPKIEVHEMKMDGSVMRMREVQAIYLPKGELVSLEPGGLHIMLKDLKKPIAEGEVIPITLFVEADGKLEKLDVMVRARSAGSANHSHEHH